MKIEKLECLILNVNEKVKQNGEHYVALGIACINDGSAFTVNSTDMKLLNLELFSRHIANFTLMDSKYGMRLTLDSIDNA